MKKRNQDVAWVLATGVGVALAAGIAMLIPVVGMVIIAMPVPYAIVMKKCGVWKGCVAVCITALIYSLIIHPYVSLVVLGIIPIALVLVYITGLSNVIYEKIAYLTLSTLVVTLVVSLGLTFLLGQNLVTYFINFMLTWLNQNQQLFSPIFDVYKQMGLMDVNITELEMIRFMQAAIRDVTMYIPVTVLAISFIMSSINITIARNLFRKTNKEESLPAIPAFSDWDLPRGTSSGFLLLFILSFLVMGFDNELGSVVFTTVSGLFMVVFSFQGLSVVECFLKYKGLNTFVRVLILGIVIITFNMILYIVGILEQFINIRKRIQGNSGVL